MELIACAQASGLLSSADVMSKQRARRCQSILREVLQARRCDGQQHISGAPRCEFHARRCFFPNNETCCAEFQGVRIDFDALF